MAMLIIIKHSVVNLYKLVQKLTYFEVILIKAHQLLHYVIQCNFMHNVHPGNKKKKIKK